MPPKQPPKTQKSSKAETTCGSGMADASNGDSGAVASSSQILNAISALKEDFVLRFDGLFSAIEGIQSELKAVSVRVTEAEDRISANQDDVTSLKTQTNTMKAAIEELVSKVDDLENRARRSNLRLVGLPEKEEGSDMCAFLERWIPEVLGEHNFPRPVLIERAHRIGGAGAGDAEAGGRSGGRPRVVIMKFLNYADKSRVMKAARNKGEILYDNQRIMFFPDVSADLVRRRKVFDSVKKELASLSIPTLRYGIIHPAKLLVTVKGRRHIFDTAAGAKDFVRGLKDCTPGSDAGETP